MIALSVHICDQRRSYIARFSADDQAAAFILARSSTHAIDALTEDVDSPDFIPATWTKTLEALYPTCEHGMSLDECYGSDHFMSADQERAMDWGYSDAPSGF